MEECVLCGRLKEQIILIDDISYCQECALILGKEEANIMDNVELDYDNVELSYDDEEPLDNFIEEDEENDEYL